MISDLKKICHQVSVKKNIDVQIRPFPDPTITQVVVRGIKDDGSEGEVAFNFKAVLLMQIYDVTLRNYLMDQIDKFRAGQRCQGIRLK